MLPERVHGINGPPALEALEVELLAKRFAARNASGLFPFPFFDAARLGQDPTNILSGQENDSVGVRENKVGALDNLILPEQYGAPACSRHHA
jgi:hypothetical protein